MKEIFASEILKGLNPIAPKRDEPLVLVTEQDDSTGSDLIVAIYNQYSKKVGYVPEHVGMTAKLLPMLGRLDISARVIAVTDQSFFVKIETILE